MDASTETTRVMLRIEDIHDDGGDRHVAVSARSDVVLTASIRRRGVLQPVGVRPNGNGFLIVFGRRRLRCARAAGLETIPADIGHWSDQDALAVRAAENMQRLALHPIDVWLTVRELVDAGYTIAEAADELGLSDRETRQMERLGRLDDALLKLAEIDMPPDHALRVIANAPAKTQAAAAKGSKSLVNDYNGRRNVFWHTIVERCRVERIAQCLAIFDPAAHPELWEEDLFSEPGDPDAIATTHVARFMQLQSAALSVRVGEQVKARRRVLLADYDGKATCRLALPKGWRVVSTDGHVGRIKPTLKPKKTESVFTALAPDGEVIEVLAVDLAAQKAVDKAMEADVAARKAAVKRQAAENADEDADDADADDDADTGDDDAEPAEAAGPKLGKAALDLIAKAKTEALHASLQRIASPRVLLRMLVLAFCADNVEVRPFGGDRHAVAARLLAPGGGMLELSDADVMMHAASMLGLVLHVGGPSTYHRNGSGAAAEWIGAAIDAAQALPRFDTAEFLAALSGETLREMATQAGIKSTGTVAALRARLVGADPGWRPDAAQFGAPAPVEPV